MIRTLAVGFDGSNGARRALWWAMDLAVQVGASVTVVHAVGLLEHSGDPAAIPQEEETVSRLVERHQIPGSRVHWLRMDGDPCSVLLRAAEDPVHADLVVVGSRGSSAHHGMLLGSTSAELAEHSRTPVVIVPDV